MFLRFMGILLALALAESKVGVSPRILGGRLVEERQRYRNGAQPNRSELPGGLRRLLCCASARFTL
jgi:hypothetical protein